MKGVLMKLAQLFELVVAFKIPPTASVQIATSDPGMDFDVAVVTYDPAYQILCMFDTGVEVVDNEVVLMTDGVPQPAPTCPFSPSIERV